MESSLEHVRPVPPVAAYVGGKKALAAILVDLIDAIDHRTYVEPFVGMGGVFLRRRRRPKAEVVNDLNRDVATFFRVVQRHYTAFLDMIRFQITTRAEFERLLKVDPDTLTDLERSARFLYLQRLAYGGKVTGRTFGVDPATPGRFNFYRLTPILEALHERLAGTVIECLPYDQVIRRYDHAGALFFLDPPYFGTEAYYGRSLFSKDDFGRLAALLSGISGSFLMTINDCEEMRRIFGAFPMREVSLDYTVGGGKGTTAREIVVASDAALLVGRQARIL